MEFGLALLAWLTGSGLPGPWETRVSPVGAWSLRGLALWSSLQCCCSLGACNLVYNLVGFQPARPGANAACVSCAACLARWAAVMAAQPSVKSLHPPVWCGCGQGVVWLWLGRPPSAV